MSERSAGQVIESTALIVGSVAALALVVPSTYERAIAPIIKTDQNIETLETRRPPKSAPAEKRLAYYEQHDALETEQNRVVNKAVPVILLGSLLTGTFIWTAATGWRRRNNQPLPRQNNTQLPPYGD